MASSEGSPLTEKEPRVYTIGGVEISFPHKAYPSQLSMMDKIIRGLTKKQNCLLESPTGSGKSLALLCSVLGWQRKCEKQTALLEAELEEQVAKLGKIPLLVSSNGTETENCSNPNLHKVIIDKSGNCQVQGVDISSFAFVEKSKRPVLRPTYSDDDDDDFKSMTKSKKIKSSPSGALMKEFVNPINYVFSGSLRGDKKNGPAFSSPVHAGENVNNTNGNVPFACESEHSELKDQVLPKKIPKIYFGTRTHKQISQIIRELKKTIYKDAKMTILSSRERSCINSHVLRADNKQEACSELVNDKNGPTCPFYRNSHRVTHKNPSRLSVAWDLEDLIYKLKGMQACPYFSARSLLQDSDIVFCPYNYLIDPMIRSSFLIPLKDNIVVLDEAHNIEDSAREAASWTLSHNQVVDAIDDLTRIAPISEDASPSYYAICNILSSFHGWLVDNEKLLKQNSFDSVSKVYSGEEMVAILDIIGAGPDNFGIFEKNVTKILSRENDLELPEDHPKLAGSTLMILKNFCFILDYVFRDSLKYMPDYRFILCKKKNKYMNAVAVKGAKRQLELVINFYCLNPAVAFSDIKSTVRTLIVASGTLSPMASFQSELDMPFEITLEANHVVSRSQMWVGTIGRGPSGSALNAVFQNTESYFFQDDVGQLVLQICSVIPYGILCFVSSYGMLDKLTSRWQSTGLWDRIRTEKVIVCEPRGPSKNFENVMHEFYNAVRESRDRHDINGALFIAVCRGKVSEGLDFADDNARAVITIGIPFPSIKDLQVDLKKKYNDANCSKKKIMSGNEWYSTQAFRALNQALGRCIRHRNDFGALIIVDERFQKQQRCVDALSKWIRKEIVHHRTFDDALNSLKEFSVRTGLFLSKHGNICNSEDVDVINID